MANLHTTRDALNPAKSVVVEACAGSGKTWLLASRIVALLLHGAKPSEILAITFTKKAAQEILVRVLGWLREMALNDETALIHFLSERELPTDQKTIHKARLLYENVLNASPPLSIRTFHAWFFELIEAAPLSTNLKAYALIDAPYARFDTLFQDFGAYCHECPDAPATQAFRALFDEIGLETAQKLLRVAFQKRAEWYLQGDGMTLPHEIPDFLTKQLQETLGIAQEETPTSDFFKGLFWEDAKSFLRFLEKSELPTDQAFVKTFQNALQNPVDKARFDGICQVFLTKEKTIRIRKFSTALEKRFGAHTSEFLKLGERVGSALQEVIERENAICLLRVNRLLFEVIAAFFVYTQKVGSEERQMDFDDAEWQVFKLLSSEETAPLLLAKLDTKYRHILLDEFQDTSPIQWQILLSWLQAYSVEDAPSVFLVGDPKQSIYRFRRAEPKLFGVASHFLQKERGATFLTQDATRRSAQPIVALVNALFGKNKEGEDCEPLFQPFRPHTSLAGNVSGGVLLPPLFEGTEADIPTQNAARNPLETPLSEVIDTKKEEEAAFLVQTIHEIVGKLLIDDKDTKEARPAAYGDLLLLVRKRTHLATYQRALAAAGIPYISGTRGGLLDALEVQDVIALLTFLVSPLHKLKLAHALRSPIFGCTDDDLIAIAFAKGKSWWEKLEVVQSQNSRLQNAYARLSLWKKAAAHLPAHDLLDRIYHEGDVMRRYHDALPDALIASALANLRALLALSLDADEGRYPSLLRFITHLSELQKRKNEEAPNEGDLATEAHAGKVRILTIHGAKGLEAPIVWYLDGNSRDKSSDYWDLLIDWPPEETSPVHYSFYGTKEMRGRARAHFFDKEAEANTRESLNLLYVAITRARQYFIMTGSTTKTKNEESAYAKVERALGTLCEEGILGEWRNVPEAVFSLAPAALPGEDPAQAPLVASPPIGKREEKPPLSTAQEEGILLHCFLENLAPASYTTSHKNIDARLPKDEAEARVLAFARQMLAIPELQDFFNPASYERAWNELSITVSGKTFRIDRLIDMQDRLIVLDYKLGRKKPEYEMQVRRYADALRPLFPHKKIEGYLVFPEGVEKLKTVI